jgi:uncharacterized membrane protein
MVGLGDFPGSDFWSRATAVSGDGSVVVGGGTAVYYAGIDGFRWTAANGLELLGYFERQDTPFSYPAATSHDGSVIVGSSDNRIFIWTEENGLSEVPAISDGSSLSYGSDISADGSVIVGSRQLPEGLRAFRYSAARGLENLGPLLTAGRDTRAAAISADGEVVVGKAGRDGWRWDEVTGLHALPRLGESNSLLGPVDVSGDGSVIVGVTTSSTNPAARVPSFIWTEERGTENLQTYLEGEYGLVMEGWTLTRLSGISDDGLVIVGGGVNPEGRLEAFVVDLRIPEPVGSVMAGVGGTCIGLVSRRRLAAKTRQLAAYRRFGERCFL